MYCRKCGKEVVGDREFCENCAAQASPVDMMTCPYCGKETSKAERFCQHCNGFFKDSKVAQKKWQPSNSATTRVVQSVNMKNCCFCGRSIPVTDFYCSKCGKMSDVKPYSQPYNKHCPSENVGSFAVGFILVWFLGLIGLLIAHSMKQSETWRGAKCCLKIEVIIVVIALAVLGFILGFVILSQI